MQKSKKHIYGAIGLAAVAGMTAVAHGIQAPQAYAANQNSDVQLKVTVLPSTPTVDIEGSLQDGGATSLDSVTIPILVTNSNRLEYTLKATQGSLSSVTIPAASGSVDWTDAFSGAYDVTLNLKEYQAFLVGQGFSAEKDIEYVFSAYTYNNGGGSRDDHISFTYGVITVDPNTNIDINAPTDETNTVEKNTEGNPIINVETGDEVKTIHVVVRDPETGKIIWEGDFPAGTDVTKIVLPFVENNIGSGNYAIQVYAYDKDGKLLGSSDVTIRYVATTAPVTPSEDTSDLGLPNTGGSIFAGLNLSEADFLISGALVFFLVAAGGIYFIHRSQTRK